MTDNVINLVEQPAPPKDVHVMVDVETLGKLENAIVLSIGAVVFSLDGLGEEFYIEIDPEKYPGSVDISTIKFWMKESASGVPCPTNGTDNIGDAFGMFDAFLKSVSEGGRHNLVIWANGTDFDLPKLVYGYAVCQAKAPWKYNEVRDARTIFKLFGPYATDIVENTQKHNALADAKWQVEKLINILQGLGDLDVYADGF